MMSKKDMDLFNERAATAVNFFSD